MARAPVSVSACRPVLACRFLLQTFVGLSGALLALFPTIQQCRQIHFGRLKSKFHLLKQMVSHVHNLVGATTRSSSQEILTKTSWIIKWFLLWKWFSWYILVPSMFGDSLQAWWVAGGWRTTPRKLKLVVMPLCPAAAGTQRQSVFPNLGMADLMFFCFFMGIWKVCDSKGKRFSTRNKKVKHPQ